MNKEELIQAITAMEWEMFREVNNIGGKANCQDDKQTFMVMRRSQENTWNDETLASYLQDLRSAYRAGLNLMTLKYAYMMKYTAPEEYEQFADQLPVIDDEALALIGGITQAHRAWDKDVMERYPAVRSRGRGENAELTTRRISASHYMEGELKTYSKRTLQAYYDWIKYCQAEGLNLAEQTLSETVKSYGYESLQAAEEALNRDMGK